MSYIWTPGEDGVTVTRPFTGTAGPTLHGGCLDWREDHRQGLHGLLILLGHVVVVCVRLLCIYLEKGGLGDGRVGGKRWWRVDTWACISYNAARGQTTQVGGGSHSQGN